MSSVVHALALLVVVLVCYYNSLQCEFVFDDMSAIKENKDLRPSTPLANLFWNDFWGTPMAKEKSHKSYRPLCVLTFRLNYLWGELEPYGYHLVNVLLHATVCILYYRMCCMFFTKTVSFLAAMLFAVHPIHTEAVTGVVGRAETLSSIFFLAALLSYSKCTGYKENTRWNHLLTTVALVTVAMLCKEQGITVIGICCVYEVFIVQKLTLPDLVNMLRRLVSGKPFLLPHLKSAIFRSIVLIGSTLMLLLARIKVMGAQLPVFTDFDNPASVAPSPARQLTFNYLLPVNAWLLLSPSQLCCDWTMGTIPVIRSIFDTRNLATVLFYTVFFKFVQFAMKERGQRARSVILCLAFLVLPFIPASNLFFPVGFVVAERILYAPSMGFCMIIALGFQLLLDHKKSLRPLLWIAMGFLLIIHSLKTVRRNVDWRSEYTIFQAALRVNQNNAKLFNNVGHALEAKEKFDKALWYFEKAVSIQPDDLGAHINVGRTYNNLNKSSEAEQAYRKALKLMPPVIPGKSYTARIAPSHLNVYLNLGNLIAKDQSRLLEAESLYKTAISMRPDYTQAYMNRGDVLMKLNRTKEAQEQYETALRYERDNADLYYNLGVVNIELKRHQDAFVNFDKALKIDPTHRHTLFNMAILIQESGNAKLRPRAYEMLSQLTELDSKNEKVFFNLGMLCTDDKRFDEAEIWFKKAIELDEKFRSALFNLALMLVNDVNRPLDAVPYLQKLLSQDPNHYKALILMGDININHLKDVDTAEQNFRKILETKPLDVQANHNLCVCFVERGDILRAEKCLIETLKLSPQETYIQQHLQIVQARIKQAMEQQQRENEAKAGPKVTKSSTGSSSEAPSSNSGISQENQP